MSDDVNSEFGILNSELPHITAQRTSVGGGKSEIRNPKSEILLLVLGLFLIFGCAHRGAKQTSVRPVPPAPTPAPAVEPAEEGWTENGIASWYGEPYHGRRTASGEVYFGSVVKVTRRDTGADVKVRVNDRGPFIEGRIIDLSYAAAKKIDLDVDGVAPVKIKVIGREAAPERKPPSAEEPEDCFWVQVGAFGDPDNARRAEAELERNGIEAVVLEGLDELWRVRVGPFDEKKRAERARNQITDAWPTAHVIPCGG